jgi:hypothetical protein
MLKRLALLVFCLAVKPAFSQLQLDTTSTPQQIANAVFTANIANFGYIGFPNSISKFYFTGDSLGLNSGLLLTTGYAGTAYGPNDLSSAGYDVGPISSFNTGPNADGDPLLDAIIQQQNPGLYSNDVTRIDFDFTAASDTLKLRYVFASEEYPEFVGSINDVFGIFLSGPGGYNYTNIAVIPGFSTPISVNTINYIDNSQYYIDNYAGTLLQYDGYTVPLTTKALVQPGASYHLTIAIGDASDGIWDCAVFVEGFEPGILSSLHTTPADRFALYPNPAKDFAMLNYTVQGKGVVQVLDALGRIVYSAALQGNAGTVQLPTSGLAVGLYHVRVLNDSNSVWNGKLVVE